MTPIFVYGALLRGGPEHRILATSLYLGTARTRAAYTMIDLGGHAAILRGGDTVIRGEVYRVGHATLAQIDRLEGHPHFYKREPIEIDYAPLAGPVATFSEREVYGYVLQRMPHTARAIACGSWHEHIRTRRAS